MRIQVCDDSELTISKNRSMKRSAKKPSKKANPFLSHAARIHNSILYGAASENILVCELTVKQDWDTRKKKKWK